MALNKEKKKILYEINIFRFSFISIETKTFYKNVQIIKLICGSW